MEQSIPSLFPQFLVSFLIMSSSAYFPLSSSPSLLGILSADWTWRPPDVALHRCGDGPFIPGWQGHLTKKQHMARSSDKEITYGKVIWQRNNIWQGHLTKKQHMAQMETVTHAICITYKRKAELSRIQMSTPPSAGLTTVKSLKQVTK